MALLLVVQWWMRDLTGKPGSTFSKNRAAQTLEYRCVMTLLRIVIQLHLSCLSMIFPENRYPLSRSCSGGAFPKKEARPKDRAHLARCAAIYSENAKKQWFVWHLVSRFGQGAP
jgi:hypothetical protein